VRETESTAIQEVARLERRSVDVDLSRDYQEIGVRSFGKGIFCKPPINGLALASKRVFRIMPDDLVLSNVFAWEGAIAVARAEHRGLIGSHRFMTYAVDRSRADPRYLCCYLLSEPGVELIRRASPGSAGRNRTLGIKAFESLRVPLPSIDIQRQIAVTLDALWSRGQDLASRQSGAGHRLAALSTALVTRGDMSDRQKKRAGWRRLPLAATMSLSTENRETVDRDTSYRIAGVYSFGRGIIDRGTIEGVKTSYPSLTRLDVDQVIISRLGAWEGAVAVVNERSAGSYVSAEFPTFTPNLDVLSPRYFAGIAKSPWLWEEIGASTRGSMARRKRVKPEHFLSIEVWLPPRAEQDRVADLLSKVFKVERSLARSRTLAAAMHPAALNAAFADIA
jgi:type I restriction enzyme S subunit